MEPKHLACAQAADSSCKATCCNESSPHPQSTISPISKEHAKAKQQKTVAEVGKHQTIKGWPDKSYDRGRVNLTIPWKALGFCDYLEIASIFFVGDERWQRLLLAPLALMTVCGKVDIFNYRNIVRCKLFEFPLHLLGDIPFNNCKVLGASRLPCYFQDIFCSSCS